MAAGTLLEIRHQEGETVEVGTVLAIVGAQGSELKIQSLTNAEVPKSESFNEEAKAVAATAVSRLQVPIQDSPSLEHLRKIISSPLVRNIA